MSFTSIPILDLSLSRDPATKPAFLAELRNALIEVGFFYIKNVGIPDELYQTVIEQGRAFFDIPMEEKLKIEMKNAPSFLGYSRMSAEITAGKVDHREQIDLSTEHAVPGPDAPRYENLLAPNQWPADAVLPKFRPAFADYIERLGRISLEFTALVAEAIGLPPDAFDPYFDQDPARQQHKLKVVKYPEAGTTAGQADSRQGVGPHKDSMYTTFLLQASHHKGLQAQNTKGEWVDAPPVDGTLVVVIGQGLEALTQGVCVSTTHRVVSPEAGAGARFSIPFFQGVRLNTEFAELEQKDHLIGGAVVPEDVKQQRRAVMEAAGGGGRLDDVEFTFRTGGVATTLGEATLRNRVKSHPDVGERWYPDILASIREEQRAAAAAAAPKAVEATAAAGAAAASTATAVPAH